MGKKAPAPPNYAAAAEKQGASSLANINAQTLANRPNQTTPWGTSTWEQSGGQNVWNPTTGRMENTGGQWNQNIELTPQQQEALNAEMGMQTDRANLAQSLTGRMESEFGNQMDWSQFGGMGDVPTAGQYNAEELQRGLSTEGLQNVDSSNRYNQDAGDALYGRATSRLDPQWEQRAEQTEVGLRNQGLRPGDQAYDRAINTMEQQRTDAYQQAGYGADIGAGAEASRMFGMDMGLRGQQFGERGQQGQFANTAAGQAFGMNLAGGGQQFGEEMASSNLQTQQRQQQIAEEMQRRGFSLNEMNAIMSGQQVGMPSMPGFQSAGAAESTNYLGAANMQNQANLDKFSADQAMTNSLMSGLGQGASMMAMSDRRLKTDIVPLGDGWYSYKLFGHIPTIGVMADEQPQATVRHWSGFDMVNYGNL